MAGNVPSRKKPIFPVGQELRTYLERYGRYRELPAHYDDLLHYSQSFPLLDRNGNDTLWESVYFSERDMAELNNALTRIYALLKTDGDVTVMDHLQVARIDFCTYGNSKPFRIRIINRLNDNYDHFYLKQADASRIYGLELEDLLSPNRFNFLVEGNTMVEEHIAGIPGDEFIRHHLEVSQFDQIRISKEFVKFNERCFVRLLGDMRSYNYVVDITPDIEGNQYRIRAIDFDQQSYEGRKNFYFPQYFKENNDLIFMGIRHMNPRTVEQYQMEERSLIAGRVKKSREQVQELFLVMTRDKISTPDKVSKLTEELAAHHNSDRFYRCTNMGQVVLTHLDLLLEKDFRQSIVFE